MKILIINPNSDVNTNEIIRVKAEKSTEMIADIEFDVVNVTKSPKLISAYLDYHLAAEEMVNIVKNDEYDAYIIACHSDPNIEIIREITDKPVIGIGEASIKMASIYGNSFAVISPSIKSISKKRGLVRKLHLQDMFLGTAVSKGDCKEDLLEAAREAKIKYSPDSIILGCANYALADRYIEKELDIQVFEGVAAAIYFVYSMFNYENIKK